MRYNGCMIRVTRRGLLAGSSGAALPLFLADAQQDQKRNLLTSAWTAGKIAAALSPRDRFRPIPLVTDAPWKTIPADARGALLEAGEKQLKGSWESLPATVFLEFRREGNRSRYEAIRNRRRDRLQELVIAESLEGKGRFIDEIVNGIWLTCEETFWGVPAHLGVQKAGTGLPDAAEPIVDLFAAETSSLLAWTHYLLASPLAQVSPLVPERIRMEIDRRVLAPCLTRDDFGWMGFSGGAPNNWNPWICSNWLASAILMERNETRRQAAVYKIVRCLDHFLNGYADDGGCDEGPSYWGRAGASLFDCLDLLQQATGGGCDGFAFPLVRAMGQYICRAHIHDEWYTNFADAPGKVFINGDLVYRFGKAVNDRAMMEHGAFGAFLRDPAAIPGDSIGRQLPALFNLSELRKAPRAQALARDAWLPGIQVMTARVKEGSAAGLYLAAQGGHNAESHNHNDVGNFLVFADGQPAIVDVGVETYTAKTFSPKRYEIWTMQSAYHNCPTIDGVMQAAGRQFAASDVNYRSTEDVAEFRLNVAKAYPAEAHLDSWIRTLRLTRSTNTIEVTEDYVLKQAPKEISLTLMTPCHVDASTAGRLALDTAARRPVAIQYDSGVFKPSVEEVRIEDARLLGTWGDRLYRIRLRASAPPLRAKWTIRITQ
jgi:hypothetical protein